MSDAFGIGPWSVWTIEPTHCTVHGSESPYSFRVALATVGGSSFELIAPHDGQSVCDEHLEEHGEGFHHTCLAYPSVEAMREAKAALRREGREVIQEGSAGELFDFAYVAFPELNSAVEIMYLDASKLPPPEVIIEPSA